MKLAQSIRLVSFVAPILVASLANAALAQTPREIPLWPNGAPGSEGKTAPEVVAKSDSGELRVSSIHNPRLTPYLPAKDKATGAAVLVIPGGGHRLLAITHEGYNVGEWLAERGVAAFVLKHRLAREEGSTYKIEVESFADAQRAMRLIRSRARSGASIRHASARWGSPRAASSRRSWPRASTRQSRCRRSGRAAAVAAGVPGADLSRAFRRHPADQGLTAGISRCRVQRSPGHFGRPRGGLPAIQARRRGGRAAHLQHRRARVRPASCQSAAGRRLDDAVRGMDEGGRLLASQ